MEPAVELHGIRKRYGNDDALKGVDLTVQRGEIFGIIGPNGAGKSTLVGIIAGLRDADAGTATVLGRDVVRDRHSLRNDVGIQLQEAQLQGMITVEEAMKLYASFYPNPRPWEPLLKTWGLEAKRKDRYDNLSGGQKQRLFICLALISQPTLVILDELTTGLDPQARRESWELVSKIRDEGATVILVTHFMDEAERLCDRIAVVDGGEIRAIGRVADLLHADGDARELHFGVPAAVSVAFLEQLPEVARVERDGDRVTVSGGPFLMAAVASALARENLDPPDLAMRHRNLEDVFIQMTGTDLTD